ncbi:MAG: nucleotidyltransferase domain-containing protein [Acidimicrobiia bacterium]
MNLTHPLFSLIPSLAGPVLEVLAHTTRPLTGREVQRLLSRDASQQGVQNVLDELAAHGLVIQMPAGTSVLNTLNRDHVLAPFILRIAGLRDELLAHLTAIVADEAPWATRAILFGSLARGEADEHSDIDLLLVRDETIPDHDIPPEEDIATRVRRLTGNPCNIVHYTTTEFSALPDRAPDLYAAISVEGIDLLASTQS